MENCSSAHISVLYWEFKVVKCKSKDCTTRKGCSTNILILYDFSHKYRIINSYLRVLAVLSHSNECLHLIHLELNVKSYHKESIVFISWSFFFRYWHISMIIALIPTFQLSTASVHQKYNIQVITCMLTLYRLH